MKTKNIFLLFIIAVASVACIIAGCNKNFLDVPAQGQQTKEEVSKDPNAASNLVLGAYNALYFGGFGSTTVGLEMNLTVDIASDDADKGSSPSDQQETAGKMDNFTVDANVAYLNNLWNGHYTAIARTNQALSVLNTATFDETIKNRLIGETRFLRGYFYFNLVRLFGGVPLILRAPTIADQNNDEFVVKKSVDSVYAAIIADLQFAVDHLPLRGGPGATEGRVNKGTAEAYLAKVYLYKKDYQKAYDLTKDIMNSGKFSLVPYPYYAAVWREKPDHGVGGNNNSESMFEVQAAKNNACDAISKLYSNGQGPRAGGSGGWENKFPTFTYTGDLGFGLNTPSADLANAYEANDTRKTATIIFVQPTGGTNAGTVLFDGFRIPTKDSVQNDRYNYKAYHSPVAETVACNGPTDKDDKPKNIRLMRFADVLLIYAEAAVQTGKTADAQVALDSIRHRAGLASVPATINNIWKERRVELAMECDRFFDVVRQGRGVQVFGPLGFTANKNEVFPIPQNQIDLSGGKLKQNQGYN
ncbi:RagB/SusD family nutrient uptake outer membrane protein [Pinibacter soli]|uniref:RagB/SusD family nutrient uptake outer membrane protein n=1 Tax=Pinibacter soli TaxID=3044211 RepID=A0ABT6RA27_9BACT|nr:RagB/SusD family nutrient uptake outer membrane protein [Pinibacter soli]MDI3318749.1 RagB/SusD family nutrient uptake outer membrane protein [Pinibacter soli]